MALAWLGLGFLFLFLSTLPLFAVGLGKRSSFALYSALVAMLAISLFNGVSLGMTYLLMFGLPSWYLARQSLLWRPASDNPQAREWFPIGEAITWLSLAGCLFFACILLYLSTLPEGIGGTVAQFTQDALKGMDAEYRDMVERFMGVWSFLIFPSTLWLWAIALYGHAWLANRMLVKKSVHIRPDFAVTEFSIPTAMLAMLALAALMSLITDASWQFAGKSLLIALLLPYCFSGAAIMHAASQSWPNRRFFLSFIYFMTFALLWPALILSGMGIWRQIKRLSSAASSSK